MWFCMNCFATEDNVQKKQDSLWSVWKSSTKSDTDRLKALDKLIWDGYLFSQPDSAYYLANIQYDFSIKKKSTKFQAKALNILGTYFTFKEDYDSAMIYYQRGMVLSKQTKNYYTLSTILNNMSNIEYYKNNYSKSLEYIYESLKISEQLKDEYLITSNLANIGSVYGDLGDRKNELYYYKKSLIHARITNDKNSLKSILYNIGTNYYHTKQYETAILYYEEALKISQEIKSKQDIGEMFCHLGATYAEIGNNDTAMFYLEKSLTIMLEVEDKSGLGRVYDAMSTVFYSENDIQNTIKYSQKVLKIGIDEEERFLIQNASETLYKIYKKQGKTKEALEMLETYHSAKDSVINDNSNKALISSQIQYEFDKKEATIKQENKIKSLKLKRRTYIIAVLSLISVLSFFIYYLIAKQNKLKASKKSIELEHKLLGSQMNTHFTFNAINSIQEYILNNQNEKAHYLLSEFSKLMRMVLTHNRKKIIAISDEIELLKKYILLEEQRIKDKINFTIINTNDVDLDNVKIPSLLIQPVVENSIWHGLRFQKSTKNIELIFTKENNETLKIEIKDNGVGLQDAENLSSDSSHGLTIVKERIRLLYTKQVPANYFKIKNNIDKEGTTTTILIPIINEFD